MFWNAHERPAHLNSLIFGRKQEGSTVRAEQVQVVDQTTLPPKCHSFVGLDRQIGSSPPAILNYFDPILWVTLWNRAWHTHTHTETDCPKTVKANPSTNSHKRKNAPCYYVRNETQEKKGKTSRRGNHHQPSPNNHPGKWTVGECWWCF